MTTIAYSEGTLAADCGLTDESKMVVRFEGKIRRLKGDRLAGFCGDVTTGISILNWLEDQRGALRTEGEVLAMVVHPDGRILTYDGAGIGVQIYEKLYAIGSGSHLAMGAMLAGASAIRAVEIAVERDGSSSFGVTSLKFEGTKPRSRRPTK